MDAAMNILKELTEHEIVAYTLLSLVITARSPHYRLIKPILLPSLVGGIVYRSVYMTDSKSLLTIVLEIAAAITTDLTYSAKLVAFIHNAIGLVVLCTLFNWVNSVSIFDITHISVKGISNWGYGYVKNFSIVQKELEKEKNKMREDFDQSLKARSRALGDVNTELPQKGWKKTAILNLMKNACAEEDKIWENGKVSGGVYFGQRKHIDMLNDAFSKYSISNPLHADIWPSVMKFESEVVAMTADLVSGGVDSVCGCVTSGGTESIILAMKAHRDYYRELHGITEPEMVTCISAHAAVNKGCDMLGIKLIQVPMDPHTFRIDMTAFRAAIGPNTILAYASAPTFPQGAIDPVRDIGELAVQYGFGVHVDCCLGGFVLPFARKAGYDIPDFEFSVPGVTSMSLDTHKYGFALKGTSVVLYRHHKLRHAQYFCYPNWSGGMYTTPTIAGSRSGGLIAQTWASMMAMGREGYEKHVADIFSTTRVIAKGVTDIEGIELSCEPDAMIVCFQPVTDAATGKQSLNIYNVADKMAKRGWSLNPLQNPACVHLCCTVAHVGKEHVFLNDLQDCVADVLLNPPKSGGNAAIYGATSSMPAGPVEEMMKVYNDVVLGV